MDRYVFGFDLRETIPNKWERLPCCSFLGDWFDFDYTPATVERLVWPSLMDYEDKDKELDNLFFLCSDYKALPKSKKGRIIAFDIEKNERSYHYEKNSGLSFIQKINSINFNFLGFDIVDISNLTSAFYSFDWEKKKYYLY